MDKSTCKEVILTDTSDIKRAVETGEPPQFQRVNTCADSLLKELEEQRRPGVVQVISTYCDSQKAYGSGFFAGKDAETVVTNFHVVAGLKTVSILTDTGETFPAKVEKLDDTNDLALLRVKGLNPSVRLNLPLAPEGTEDKSLDVTSIGHKRGNPEAGYAKGHLASAKAMAYRDINLGGQLGNSPEVQEFLQKHPEHADDVQQYLKGERKYGPVPLWHGDSGGPLLDKNKNVTGVNSAVSADLSNAIFVPVDKVRALLNGPDEKFAYRYEKKSNFDFKPVQVLATDGALAAVTLKLPRVGAFVWGGLSAMQMTDSVSVLSSDKFYGAKSKYILDASEAGIGIGGMALSMFSKVRPVGFALMGVKAAWSIGSDFVKDKDVLMDVWRKDGGTREPLGWTSTKEF